MALSSLAYVVGRYPEPSETFIAREIEALEARGVKVWVFPLWHKGPRPARHLADFAHDLFPPRHERPAPSASAGSSRVQVCERWPAFQRCDRKREILRWQCYFLASLFREPRAAARALWYLSTTYSIMRRFEALGIERVHAQFGNLPSTVGWIAASLAKLPFSFAVHARDAFVEPHFLAAKARAADHIIACNSAVAARVGELAKPPDRAKIERVPHGLPLERYPFRAEPAGGDPLILGVGRLVEKKGFLDLVRAVARLRERGERVACWLIGDGPEREALRRGIGELGLEGAVVLKGWMPHGEVMAAYERAAALVAPSIVARDGDRDGLPNVVVEAAAKGLPIVATNVGGLGDLVRDGETGLVAQPGNAEDLAERIHAVLKDAAGARTRAKRAREEVEARFDQAQCVARLLALLSSAPHPPSPPGRG